MKQYRYETLQLLIQKLEKLHDNCENRLSQIETDFKQVIFQPKAPSYVK
jgi:hypothetical protein